MRSRSGRLRIHAGCRVRRSTTRSWPSSQPTWRTWSESSRSGSAARRRRRVGPRRGLRAFRAIPISDLGLRMEGGKAGRAGGRSTAPAAAGARPGVMIPRRRGLGVGECRRLESERARVSRQRPASSAGDLAAGTTCIRPRDRCAPRRAGADAVTTDLGRSSRRSVRPRWVAGGEASRTRSTLRTWCSTWTSSARARNLSRSCSTSRAAPATRDTVSLQGGDSCAR